MNTPFRVLPALDNELRELIFQLGRGNPVRLEQLGSAYYAKHHCKVNAIIAAAMGVPSYEQTGLFAKYLHWNRNFDVVVSHDGGGNWVIATKRTDKSYPFSGPKTAEEAVRVHFYKIAGVNQEIKCIIQQCGQGAPIMQKILSLEYYSRHGMTLDSVIAKFLRIESPYPQKGLTRPYLQMNPDFQVFSLGGTWYVDFNA